VELHQFQREIVDRARERMRSGVRSMVIVSPTGSGKTVLTAYMLSEAARRGHRSVFTVHRRELIQQTIRALGEFGIEPGVIASGFDARPDMLVQVASIQTLARRLDGVKCPRLLIMDECHHAPAGTWAKVADAFRDAIRIGLTATPERLDGQGLEDQFEAMVLGPPVACLIEDGYLAPYRAVIPPGISVEGVHRRAGDYRREELAEIVGTPTVTGDAVREYVERASGRRAIAYTVSVELSRTLAGAFRDAGVAAEHVDADTPSHVRDAAMERFRAGETMVMCNVDLFGEGIDVPAVEAGIFLRPTCSLALYLQQVGRILRVSPGKFDALLLDHAGNIIRHGLPDDNRAWSLAGQAESRECEAKKSTVRICPNCYAASRITGQKQCAQCRQPFPTHPRVIETRDGRLEEVDVAEIRRARAAMRREQVGARDRQTLMRLATERGYRNPAGWAHMVMRGRQAKKLTGGGR